MKTNFLVAAVLAIATVVTSHAAMAADHAPFVLLDLPYAADALKPAIDARTMEIHHGRHHKAYVDNLNAKTKDFPALATTTLEEILAGVSGYDAAVRNSAGGHYNHSLFWKLMAPVGKTGEPSAALTARISKDFGSLDAFKKAFDQAASRVFALVGYGLCRSRTEHWQSLRRLTRTIH